MKNIAILIISVLFLISFSVKPKSGKQAWVNHAIENASYQLKLSANTFADSSLFPRSLKCNLKLDFDSRKWISNGSVNLVNAEDWTSGFFPGSLWYEYELTGDDFFKSKAIQYSALLKEIQYYKADHDIGFRMYCSYGNELRLLKDTLKVTSLLVNSSETLISRYSDKTKSIRSWDAGSWSYPVIIDNMMNLELLLWTSEFTGNPKYKEIAINHANTTMKNHFRADYSSYHVISYNPETGDVESKGTLQGFSDESSWARGQAWGLYGFTVMYRYTKDIKYLNLAHHIAANIMNHPNKTKDLIPYWDYNAPTIPNAPRDASAAAITASALLELSTMVEGIEKRSYFSYAETILKNLSTPNYLAKKGENGGFILKHSVGFLKKGVDVDSPINYADYYYLESLVRYLNMQKK
jgi:unsaturated chondroitin disaccharide hydrolase